MQVQINDYNGPGFLGANVPAAPKRDGINLSRKGTVKAFREMGDRALNVADFEKTRFLPVGRGRLACDETGEFDPDAVRVQYNPAHHPLYPMHLHSTMTEGEHLEVKNEDEKSQALASRRWSEKPLEKRRRFTLSPENQLVSLKEEVEAERAVRREMERRLDATLTGENPAAATLMAQDLVKEREARLALETRVQQLMDMMQAQLAPKTELKSDSDADNEKKEDTQTSRNRNRSAA